MNEKVLGFKKNRALEERCGFKTNKKGKIVKEWFCYSIREDNLVPVVSLKALKEYVINNRKLLSKLKPASDFDAGELSGKIEALEVLLSWASEQSGEVKNRE